MGSKEENAIDDLKEKIFNIYRDFMTGITKIDELGAAGSRLLIGFQQALEFIRRPPIDRNSEVVNKIIVANETKRVKSYFEAGCKNPYDGIQKISQLQAFNLGLLDHITKAKEILNELKVFLEDVTNAIQSTRGSLPVLFLDLAGELNEQESYNDKEKMALSDPQGSDVTHLATLMGIIYSMVKQDYLMQERIISALNLKSSSGELESYSLMWSLRPFINDDVIHQAWKLIP